MSNCDFFFSAESSAVQLSRVYLLFVLMVMEDNLVEGYVSEAKW